MNSNSRCIPTTVGIFGRGSIAAPTSLVCLAAMPRLISRPCIAAALIAVCCATAAGAAESADSAQAKAKLAAVRAHIAELTAHLSAELAQRDAMNARLRDADLAILAKHRRL